MTSVSSTTSTSSTSSSTSTSSTDYLTFDTESLVEAKLESRYERIDSLNTEVSDNETKIAAYEDMQDLLQSLTTTLEALRADPSSTGKTSDVFRDRTAYLTASDGSTASTYMSATVDEGTDLGTHSVTITQVATTNIVSSVSQSSRYDDLDWSGTISVGTKGGSSAEIAITDNMSLGDIADAINAQTTTTGVVASIMQVSSGSYRLVMTTEDTGETITLSDVSGTLLSSSSNLGILDSSGDIQSDNVLQKAQDAIMSVDGVTITRSTNDIDDVLDGITFHLYAATSSTLSLEVDNDLTGISDAINAFVTAYNSFRDFVVTNQATSTDGTASDDATLFGDATLRDIATEVQSALSSGIDETSLAAIGITFDDDNKLEIDSTTLQSALLDDLDGIQSLFTYTMTTSSGDLGMVRHPDSSLSFTLDLAVSGDTLTASIGGDSSLFTVSGTSGAWTLTGTEGSAYEGLTLVYTGTTSKSITVSTSQGIADQLYSDVNAVSDEDDGSLATLIDSLEDQNDDLNEKISALEDSTSSYKSTLTTLYASIASKLAAAETTLDLLKALLNADSSD